MSWIRRLSSSAAATAIWGAALLVFAYQLWRQRGFFHDDAYISLRYVLNLVEHGQLEWNLGERVEGYTNFLHIVASALLVALGIDPVQSLRVVNGAAIAGLGFAGLIASGHLAPRDRVAAAVGTFLVLGTAPVALWVLGGLEAVPEAAFIAAAIATIIPVFAADERGAGRSMAAGLLIGLAYLVRPDSLTIGGTVILSLLWLAPAPFAQRLRQGALVAAGAGALVVPHVAWRYFYYGDLLPNTFYAKVGLPLAQRLASGAPYVGRAMYMMPVIPLAIAAIAVAGWTRRITPAMGMLAAGMLTYMLGILWVGGDHMQGARLLVPVVGPAALLIVACISRLEGSALRTAAVCAALAIAAAGAFSFPAQRMDKAALVGSIVGRYIAESWPAGSLVALHTAGSTPYFAPQMRYIDMLGLNDREIAHRSSVPIRVYWQTVPGHAKGDGAYVLRREPAYIIVGPAAGTLLPTVWFLSDVELAESEEFHRCYEGHQVDLPYPDEEEETESPEHGEFLVFSYYQRVC